MADEQTAASSDANASQSAAAAAASAAASRQQADRPAWAPEAFWDAEKKAVNAEALAGEFTKLDTARKTEDERRAALPKTAGEYKVELPEGYKLPEGMELDLKNPSWSALAEFAHKRGLSQQDFAEGARLWTEAQIANQAAFQKSINDYKAAEEAKLGDNAKARVEAVHRFVDAGFDAETAKGIKGSLANAAIVGAFEKMISALQAGGITAFNGNGRQDGPKPGEIPGYDKMSFVEKYRHRQTPQRAS